MSGLEFSRISITNDEAKIVSNMYDDLFVKVKDLANCRDLNLMKEKTTMIIDIIKDNILAKEGALLLYAGKIIEDEYSFSHALNVSLISARLGVCSHFIEARLKNLILSGLLHSCEDMDIPKEFSQVIEKDSQVEAIVGLADIYDSLTHPPTYRGSMTSFETLTSMIEAGKFDRHLVKSLLEELSLYPINSWVELSTDEIGQVIEAKKAFLLRPTVKVVLDWNGNRLKEEKIIDLTKKSTIHVTRPLTKEEVSNICGGF